MSDKLAHLIAEHSLAQPYRQVRAMNSDDFQKWLSKRGVHFSSWGTIHWLWAVGLVQPVGLDQNAIAQTPNLIVEDRFAPVALSNGKQILVDRGMSFPVAEPMPDWYRNPDSALKTSLLWHPFQLYVFKRLRDAMKPRYAVEMGLRDPENYANCVKSHFQKLPAQLVSIATDKSLERFPALLALMTAIEPIVHGQIYGTISINPRAGESFDGYYEWLAAFNSVGIIENIATDFDEISAWHQRLSIAADLNDPLDHFRVLLQHADKEDLARLGSDALLALEFYNQALSLRRFAETHYKVEMYEEDDYRTGPQNQRIKEERYGSRRTLELGREGRARILREFGLDTQPKAVWFLEGPTEVAFYERFAELEGLDLDGMGLLLYDLEGKDRLGKNPHLHNYLVSLQKTGTFAHVCLDRDDSGKTAHIEDVKRRARQGLLTGGFTIWEPDFEAANLSERELAQVAESFARQVDDSIRITEEDLTERIASSGEPAGKVIEKILRSKKVFVTKGPEWGRALADAVMEASQNDPDTLKPVVENFKLLYSVTRTDYHFQVDEFEVADDGKMVQRPPQKPVAASTS